LRGLGKRSVIRSRRDRGGEMRSSSWLPSVVRVDHQSNGKPAPHPRARHLLLRGFLAAAIDQRPQSNRQVALLERSQNDDNPSLGRRPLHFGGHPTAKKRANTSESSESSSTPVVNLGSPILRQNGLADRREAKLESRTGPGIAGRPQSAAMRLDDGSANRQAHTHTFGFGGEECVEQLTRIPWVNTDA
jgi:hypothetical protein